VNKPIKPICRKADLLPPSHDLLQPMHGRLFSTVLEQSVHSEQERQTLQQLDRAFMVQKVCYLPFWILPV
jgi:hypothetical protein